VNCLFEHLQLLQDKGGLSEQGPSKLGLEWIFRELQLWSEFGDGRQDGFEIVASDGHAFDGDNAVFGDLSDVDDAHHFPLGLPGGHLHRILQGCIYLLVLDLSANGHTHILHHFLHRVEGEVRVDGKEQLSEFLNLGQMLEAHLTMGNSGKQICVDSKLLIVCDCLVDSLGSA
jgi:hypothetical protein